MGVFDISDSIKSAVNLRIFMYKYYGIILDLDIKYSHELLKKIFGNFNSEDSKKNKDNLIYVVDDFGNICLYTRPNVIINNIEKYVNDVLDTLEIIPTNGLYELLGIYKYNYRVYMSIRNELMNRHLYVDEYDKRKLDDILIVLNDIPTYALHELLSTYKRYYSIYRRIKNELIRRGEYDNKLYKLKEVIDKVEETADDYSELDYDFSQCTDDCRKFNHRLKMRSKKKNNRKGKWY